jgi:hypothetical protein
VGEVILTVPPRPLIVVSPVVPMAPQPQPSRTGPLLVKIGLGTAIAGAAVGILAGVTAMTKAGQLPGECHDKECPSSTGGQSDLASARTWATVSNVAFAVGGVGAVVGLVGLWRSRSTTATVEGASLSPWIGVGAAGLDGRF